MDENTFLLAKASLENNKNGPRKRTDGKENRYLLFGKIFCGECGSPMTGSTSKGRSRTYHYYVCKDGSCKKRKVKKDAIEELVLEEARILYRDEDLKRLFVSTFTKVFSKIMKGSVDERALLDVEIEKLEDKKRKVLDAIVANPEISEDLRVRLGEVSAELSSLKQRRMEHESNLEALEVTEEDVAEFLDSIFASGEDDEFTVRNIIDSLIQRVTVWDGGHVEIIFNVLKAPVLAEIEKSPKTGDFSHLLREDGAYKSKLVDREGLEPATR